MSFALTILLEGILDGDGLIHEELAVHRFNGGVRRLEVGVGNEAVTF